MVSEIIKEKLDTILGVIPMYDYVNGEEYDAGELEVTLEILIKYTKVKTCGYSNLKVEELDNLITFFKGIDYALKNQLIDYMREDEEFVDFVKNWYEWK